ncbi:hypothetical protein BDP27DRAFT_1361545 [Rhodocollybia butyracea]|uniref:Uncharacterized protein n=1 Tax=Rhodocollybia butyracea TaxID=206335 RepID=A0A9P5PZ24_9AGAR|nr:hypothetical protein BDP27DRAFT_1361545 [Rhodocollybia butyracea]
MPVDFGALRRRGTGWGSRRTGVISSVADRAVISSEIPLKSRRACQCKINTQNHAWTAERTGELTETGFAAHVPLDSRHPRRVAAANVKRIFGLRREISVLSSTWNLTSKTREALDIGSSLSTVVKLFAAVQHYGSTSFMFGYRNCTACSLNFRGDVRRDKLGQATLGYCDNTPSADSHLLFKQKYIGHALPREKTGPGEIKNRFPDKVKAHRWILGGMGVGSESVGRACSPSLGASSLGYLGVDLVTG